MKFSEKYPNMAYIHEQTPQGIIRGTKLSPCHECKEPTEYVDIHYEGAFCSEECVDKMDTKYFTWCAEEDDYE